MVRLGSAMARPPCGAIMSAKNVMADEKLGLAIDQTGAYDSLDAAQRAATNGNFGEIFFG